MNKCIIASIAIAILIVTSKSTSQCPSYTIKPLLDKMLCMEQLTHSEYYIQPCPQNHKCVISDNEGICELSDSFIYELGYPGSICQNDEDCYSLICRNDKCHGSSLEENCFSTADCFFGQVCFKGYCNNPKPKNSLCIDHQQCEFPLYCHNGRCTQLFSLEDGTLVEEEYHFLCKSGKVYNNLCNQVKNINTECDDSTPCLYEDKAGNIILIESACKCPYHSQMNQAKKCIKGDIDNKAWLDALALIKESIEKNNVKKCNLEEKRPGFCLELLKNNWSVRQKQHQLEILLIEAEYKPLLSDDNKPMIMKTIFGIDDISLHPKDGFKCPIYTSSFPKNFIANNVCVSTINPFNENGDQLVAYVNKLACSEGFKCSYDPNTIFKEKSYNATCIEKNYWKSSYHLHLPGDKCTSSDQCQAGNYPEVGLCNDGICSGRPKGKRCKTHIDCMIGLYCSKNGLCEKQQGNGGECRDEYECQNKYGCMNRTCYEYYSLPRDAYLEYKNPNAAFCEFGFENEKTHQCVELTYDSNGVIGENGFIECDFPNQKCNYTNGNGNGNNAIISMQCQCGFNPFGKAYCPLSHNENRDKWKKYFDKKRLVQDNNCHTLKRGNCPGYDYTDEINYYQHLSERAHLFYLAEEDVIEVLTSLNLSLNSIMPLLLCLIVLIGLY